MKRKTDNLIDLKTAGELFSVSAGRLRGWSREKDFPIARRGGRGKVFVDPGALGNWMISTGRCGRLTSVFRIASDARPEESRDSLQRTLALTEFWAFESYKRSRGTPSVDACFELWCKALAAFTGMSEMKEPNEQKENTK